MSLSRLTSPSVFPLLAALIAAGGLSPVVQAQKASEKAKPAAEKADEEKKGEKPDKENGKSEEEDEDEKDATKEAESKSNKPDAFKEDHKILKGGPYFLPGDKQKTGFGRNPYVQCPTSTSAVIVWRSRKEMAAPSLSYGLGKAEMKTAIPSNAITKRRLEKEGGKEKPIYSAPMGHTQYEVKIEGLKPGTRYFYQVSDGDTVLTEGDGSYSFQTLPEYGAKTDALFWVVGDSGTASKSAKDVHTAMRQWATKNNRKPDLFIHVGDMAYKKGKDLEFTDTFFNVYEQTLRETACFPAQGNHEGLSSNGKSQLGPYYDAYVLPTEGQSGGVASGTEAYYSYDWGRTHCIVLNSHDLDRKPAAVMGSWLREDLDRIKAEKTDWIIAYWHHPAYSKGTHNSDKDKQMTEMRKYILPILESGGVDLVLCGHSHIYERSMLIDGAYGTPTAFRDAESKLDVVLDDSDGTPATPYRKTGGITPRNGSIHVTAGHGGAEKNSWSHGLMPIMKKVSLEYGSVLLDFKETTLTGTMLTSKGEVADTFQLIKSGVVPIKRIANPRQDLKPPATKKKGDEGIGTPYEGFPLAAKAIVPKDAVWRYAYKEDPSEPAWREPAFDDASWLAGKAPLGYGVTDPSLGTDLKILKGEYSRLYARHSFTLTADQLKDVEKFGILMAWDDAFVAYLNGKEIIRREIPEKLSGSAVGANDIKHVGDKYPIVSFPMKAHAALFKVGSNTLAFEAHNNDKGSSDFLIRPSLVNVTEAAKPEPEDDKGIGTPFIDLPTEAKAIVPDTADWNYVIGSDPAAPAWQQLAFDDSSWKKGKAPIGYGVDDVELGTDTKEMKGKTVRIYTRLAFTLTADQVKKADSLALAMAWDDGFIAYLNGTEIVRREIKPGASGAKAKAERFAGDHEVVAFPLKENKALFKAGKNILAIEGHNSSASSSDILLQPSIVALPVAPVPAKAEPAKTAKKAE